MRLLPGPLEPSLACERCHDAKPAELVRGGRWRPCLLHPSRDLRPTAPCKRHCVSRPAPRAPPSGRAPPPAPAGRWRCPGPPPRSRSSSRMPRNRIAAPCWPLWWRRERRSRRRRCAGGVAPNTVQVCATSPGAAVLTGAPCRGPVQPVLAVPAAAVPVSDYLPEAPGMPGFRFYKASGWLPSLLPLQMVLLLEVQAWASAVGSSSHPFTAPVRPAAGRQEDARHPGGRGPPRILLCNGELVTAVEGVAEFVGW